MGRLEREALKSRIVNFFLDHNCSKTATVSHFQKERIPRRTIYSIIVVYQLEQSTKDAPRSGRPRKLQRHEVKRLKSTFNHKTGCSLRASARKFNVSHQTIANTLAKESVRYLHHEKAAAFTEKQLPRIIKNSRKLATNIFVGKSVVIDDEKYFTLSNSTIAGNRGYWMDNKANTSDEVRFAQKAKFEPKVLVWLAISEHGMSRPFIQATVNAINAQRYINNCLRPRLLPFVQKHHADGNYIFWPDMASAHYAGMTLDWLETNNIPFVRKQDNPPSVPQARPIENFWGDLSSKVYAGGWSAKTKQQLINRIKRKLKECDVDQLQSHFRGLRGKLRNIADKGPLSIINKK